MTTTLQQLVTNLDARFPNVLPPRHTEISELYYLQGQREVVEYVLSYLKSNQQEDDRESILKGS